MVVQKLSILYMFLHVLALPLLPIAVLVILFLWIIRLCIKFWLQWKLGDQFGGLFISADNLYAPKSKKGNKICLAILYVRCSHAKDILETLKRTLQVKIFDSPDENMKLTSKYHTFLGQNYYIKNQLTLNDVLRPFPLPSDGTTFDSEYMKKISADLATQPFPKNDSTLWDVYSTNEPLANIGSSGEYFYPIVIRVHHAMADGVRLIAFFLSTFSFPINQVVNYTDFLITQNVPKDTLMKNVISLVENIIFQIHMPMIAIVTYLKLSVFKQKDRNSICRSKLSGEKLVSWAVADHLVNKVKKIKNTIPDTRFSDVLFTCISASVCNYFVKKNHDIPEKISCMLPILVSLTNKSRLELRNDFTFGPLELPLVDSSDLLGGLKKVKLSLAKMKNSHDKDVIYWAINNLSAPLPAPVVKFLENTTGYTMVISSVPGISGAKMFGDCDVVNIFPIAPHSNNTGLTMTIITYDNKFHISLLADKAIISNQQDIQMIVDNVLNNITVMDKACDSAYNNKCC